MLGMLGAGADTTSKEGEELEAMRRAQPRGGREDGGDAEEGGVTQDCTFQRLSVLLGATEHLPKMGRKGCSEREQDGGIPEEWNRGGRMSIQRCDCGNRRGGDEPEDGVGYSRRRVGMGVGGKGDGESGGVLGRRGCRGGRMGSVVEVGGSEEGDEHDGDERVGSDALPRELGAVSEGSMAPKDPKVSE